MFVNRYVDGYDSRNGCRVTMKCQSWNAGKLHRKNIYKGDVATLAVAI